MAFCDNLNSLYIPNDGRQEVEALTDYSTTSGEVEVVFDDIAQRLILEISRHEVAVGCVAWLSHPAILQALSMVECQLVVQKEDFLRPDLGTVRGKWPLVLRKMYLGLSFELCRGGLPAPLPEMSYCTDPSVDPVRCLGQIREQGAFTRPLMHHKFLVFGERGPSTVNGYERDGIIPTTVWTGSFNFSKNSSCSLENAVIIHNPMIASAYLGEWAQLLALSEPLDWESRWVQPEWRMGS